MAKLNVKQHWREVRLFQNRCIVLSIIILIMALAVIARLIYLQIFSHQFYTTLSQQNIVEVLPLPPKRGLIFDRNGILLAKNIPSYTLEITPEKTQHLNATIARINKIIPITSDDIKHFKLALNHHHRFDPTPLKFHLSESQVDTFYVNHFQFPSASIKVTMLRHYPLGSTTSQVVGYVGRINSQELAHLDPINYSDTNYIGKTGIERKFEQQLHGTVGHEEVETNAAGRIMRILKKTPPISGSNLYLTIDSRLEKATEAALTGKVGAVVAIDPNNGQVLALVSNPSYNPNLFVDGISEQAYKKLTHAPGNPMINRATLGQFAPGSTMKPFYAIEGLDSGTITPQYQIFDPGWFKLPNNNHIFHDWQRNGHGWVNYAKAIMVSCDTFFYGLAVKLGIHRLDSILDRFGFGHITGIALPSEDSGLVPTPFWKMGAKGHPWYTGDTVNAGIGQGYVLVTPLQLAMATAALSLHGQRYKPMLIMKTQAPKKTALSTPAIPLPPVVLKHNWVWNDVINAMQQVITNPHGTGLHFGRHPGYTVAAKTGTAQVYGHSRDEYAVQTNIPKRLRNNELFIAFAPIRHPKIALAVVIEHDGNASAVARKVIDAYFNEIDYAQKVSTQ